MQNNSLHYNIKYVYCDVISLSPFYCKYDPVNVDMISIFISVKSVAMLCMYNALPSFLTDLMSVHKISLICILTWPYLKVQKSVLPP